MSELTDDDLDARLGALDFPDEPLEDDAFDESEMRRWLATGEPAAVEARLLASAEYRAGMATLEEAPSEFLLARLRKAIAPSNRRAWVLAVAAALIVGAAVGLLALREGPLTSYELELAGSLQNTRSEQAPKTEHTYLPESEFKLTLRPAEAVDGAPQVGVFVSKSGGPMRRISMETLTGGTLRVRQLAPEVFTEGPGQYTIAVALGVEDPDALTGQTPQATRESARRWLIQVVEYRTEPK